MSHSESAMPRLLAGVSGARPVDHAQHLRLHGALPESLPGLIDQLARAGLRGHGGGGFPFARKLEAVSGRRGRPIVVVNATEGEPLSAKDKLLLTHTPHLVIDGALAAAAVLGAREVVIAAESGAAVAAVDSALAQRPRGRRERVEVSVQMVSGGYLAGQETALIAALSGREALPMLTPPYPFERGLRGRPTLVSNAETYAQAALIARHGASWFRALGTAQSPGTRLITLSGAVSRPGVIEVAGGSSIAAALLAAGGASEPLQGILLGGYAGVWAGPEAQSWQLGESELRARGATLGPGIVHVLGSSGCPVDSTAHAVRWLHEESAGQCGPCVNGLDAIACSLEELRGDGDRSGAFAHLERWCSLITRRGACALPDGAARLVTSALRSHRAAFEQHARYGGCEACAGRSGVRAARQRAGVAA